MKSIVVFVVGKTLLLFVIFHTMLFRLVFAHKVTLYTDFNTKGQRLRVDDIYDCTPLPENWHHKISSIDSHDNCLIFYDLPYCKGRLIQVKVTEDDPRVLNNLKDLGFNDVIKSVKPCPVEHVCKVDPGTYKIQNVGNNKYLTARDLQVSGWTKFQTKSWKKSGSQKWKVQINKEGSYLLIPKALLNEFPVSFNVNFYDRDEAAVAGVFLEREYWDLVYLHEDVAMIRNSDSKQCLVMDEEDGDVSPKRCNEKSRHQQWRFYEL